MTSGGCRSGGAFTLAILMIPSLRAGEAQPPQAGAVGSRVGDERRDGRLANGVVEALAHTAGVTLNLDDNCEKMTAGWRHPF